MLTFSLRLAIVTQARRRWATAASVARGASSRRASRATSPSPTATRRTTRGSARAWASYAAASAPRTRTTRALEGHHHQHEREKFNLRPTREFCIHGLPVATQVALGTIINATTANWTMLPDWPCTMLALHPTREDEFIYTHPPLTYRSLDGGKTKVLSRATNRPLTPTSPSSPLARAGLIWVVIPLVRRGAIVPRSRCSSPPSPPPPGCCAQVSLNHSNIFHCGIDRKGWYYTAAMGGAFFSDDQGHSWAAYYDNRTARRNNVSRVRVPHDYQRIPLPDFGAAGVAFVSDQVRPVPPRPARHLLRPARTAPHAHTCSQCFHCLPLGACPPLAPRINLSPCTTRACTSSPRATRRSSSRPTATCPTTSPCRCFLLPPSLPPFYLHVQVPPGFL